MRRHDSRRPARHRLEHRDAEALVQRRVCDTERTAVQAREVVVPDLALPANPLAARLDADPTRCAGDPQLDAETLRRLDRAREVLARLEGAHCENVVADSSRETRRAPKEGRHDRYQTDNQRPRATDLTDRS